MMNVVLHTPDKILSFRHAPSWLLLTFAAGCVNATAYLACERFVSHVTGTVTRVGMGVARIALFVDLLIVVLCFIAGAMLAGVMTYGRALRKKQPLHTLPLVLVVVATSAVAVAGHAGLLGAFGGEVDQPADFVFLSMLSFASGLQNAAVATSTGLLVRTTHLTGPTTDLALHLVQLLYAGGEERKVALRHALLRGGKLLAFGLGAAAAYVLCSRLEYLTLLISAAAVTAAIVLSFSPRSTRVAGVGSQSEASPVRTV